MNQPDTLRHLLQVEADAAVLVDNAQAEADKRLAEGERQNRSRYEERYAQEVAALDADFEKEIDAIKEDYQKQLDAYRRTLDTMAVQAERFSGLMSSLLIKEG
jgi:regulator of protease activity HflC (stomatin/prohibitin superfamily)